MFLRRHCLPATALESMAVCDKNYGSVGDTMLTTASCRPILTPKTVLPLFFAVGIIFAPIGGLLLWASSEVRPTEPQRVVVMEGGIDRLTLSRFKRLQSITPAAVPTQKRFKHPIGNLSPATE